MQVICSGNMANVCTNPNYGICYIKAPLCEQGACNDGVTYITYKALKEVLETIAKFFSVLESL